MKQQKATDMTILPQLDKACGLDIHKDKIVGFIACKDGSGQELKEFGTFTCELQKVKEWLQANQVEHCPNGKHRHLLDEPVFHSYRLWHIGYCCKPYTY